MITYGSTTLTSYNTITNIEVYYYQSTSATSLSGGSWSTNEPTWVNGRYIWQKIRTTYEGKLENGLYYSESEPVNITGQKGSTGTSAYSYKLNASDTIVTISKTGVYSTNKITFSATSKQGTGNVNAYAGRFKIETTSDGTTWTTRYPASGTGVNESSTEFTIPEGVSNIRCSLYQAGGLSVLLDIVSVSIINEGKDGTSITITSTSIKYQKGTSGTVKPTGTWGTSIPSLAENEFLWTQTIVNYSDGTSTEAYSVSRNAKNGTNGTSPTVSSTVVEYQQSTGGTTPPTGTWSSTAPTATAGQYMWTKTTITYSDGKTAVSYSVSKNGVNGIDGIDGTSQNLLLDVYAPSLTKVKAPWGRYLSDVSNTTITGEFIAESNLPDPNATHFYRITDSSASTKGRGLCFYNGGIPPLLNGHTYKVGCWVRKHAGQPRINIYLGSVSSWINPKTITNTEWEWVECVHTFGDTDPSINAQASTYKRLYFYFYNKNVEGSSLDMCGFKAEEIQTNISTARNYLLKTKKLKGWGATNGTTINDGIVTFPEVTANTWREFYPTKNFKYEIIRNKNIIFSVRVKADVGKICACNLCIGVDSTETAYTRQKYTNNFVYFTGTGEWQTICVAIPISDEYFTSGSGTPDYDNCWITVRIGAVNTYYNSFQAKEPQLSLGTTATAWSAAPEDVEEEISTLRTDLQSQIDEKIQTYYQSINPATWSVDERTAHDGDLWCYTGTTTSTYTKDNVYRYNASNNTWTVYSASGELFDKVDGKTTIYYGTTSGTYSNVKIGDYLVDSTDGSSYRWDGNEWIKVTDYKTGIDAAQSSANTANTKVDNLKKVRLGWKVNYSAYRTANNGECYFHGYDSSNAPADVDGKVEWNGTDLTITKGMWINPNKVAPYNTPVLHVYRTSVAPHHADVWWDDTQKKWCGYMYKDDHTPDVTSDATSAAGEWVWDEATDCILATYVSSGSEGAITSAQLFNPPKKFSELPDPSLTQDLIDNIEIGGRNLVWRSNWENMTGKWSNWGSPTTREIVTIDGKKWLHLVTSGTKYQGYNQNQNHRNGYGEIKKGDQITVSFTAYAAEENITACIGMHWNNPTSGLINQSWATFALSTSPARYSKTLVVNGTGATGFNIMVGDSSTDIKELWITDVKAEKGNKATDWTPALEDTDASIQQVQNNLDNLEIGSRNLLKGTASPNFVTTSAIYDSNWRGMSGGNGSFSIVEVDDSPVSNVNKTFRVMNNTTGNRDFVQLVKDFNINWGGQWVFSCYARGINGSVKALIRSWNSTDSNAALQYTQTIPETVWTKIIIKIPEDMQWNSTAGSTDMLDFRFGISGAGSIEYIAPKLERGNKATDWSPAPEDTQADIDTALAQSVEYIIGTQTAATGNWTGVSSSLTELKDGTQIRYWLPYAGSGNATLNLTLKDGTSTGAIPIYRQGGSYNTTSQVVVANRVTTHFPAGTSISMVYGVNRIVSAVSSSVTYTGTFTGWFADGAYDSGNTYNRTRMQNAITAATAITAGRIICGTSSGYKNIGANITFDLSYPLLYASSAIAATKTGDNNYLQINGISASNNGTITSGAAKKELYLKGTVSGNIFTISASPFMTTVVPTSADGFYYIPLGLMSSATAIYFISSNRLYAYIDGAFQPVDTAAVLRAQDAKDLATAVYGTCSTGATTVDKVVTCSNFTLFDGARIQITFTNANTAIASEATTASPTLNVNGTGRKPIKIGIEEANTANPLYWAAGATIEFVYDGSAWVLQNAPYTLYGTCNTEENVREKQVVCDGAVICKGTTIYVDMLYSNTADSNSENGNVTLNVANTIAKTIYANNATLTIRSRYNWNAGENPSFTFDGQYWQMDKDTVPAYITDKDEDGIFVHPINDTASGWSIGKVFELLNNGYSYIKMWLEDVTDNLSAKIRIGREDQHHILLDKEIIQFKKGDTPEELASFSSSGISFDDGVPFKIGNDSTYVQFVDNDSDGVADALEIVADKISFKNGGDDTAQDIQERFNDLQTDISNITNSIEINPTADTPYVAITTQKNEYNAGLKLEPTQLSFQLNGQTTATIANDEMNIPTASVTNLFMQSANQSYEKIWVMRSNGHLSLKVGKQN